MEKLHQLQVEQPAQPSSCDKIPAWTGKTVWEFEVSKSDLNIQYSYLVQIQENGCYCQWWREKANTS